MNLKRRNLPLRVKRYWGRSPYTHIHKHAELWLVVKVFAKVGLLLKEATTIFLVGFGLAEWIRMYMYSTL